MARKLTTEEFVEKARSVHGDKYDYGQTIYSKATEKVKIKCKTHGFFEQVAQNHIYYGKGCNECSRVVASKKRRTTLDFFLEKSREVHGNKYDYSLVEYKSSGEDVQIICPRHGSFFQNAGVHYRGHDCPKCGFDKISVNKKDTLKSFKKKALEVHGDKYSYELVDYKGSSEKVDIICPTHGVFSQTPAGHLATRGCKQCGVEASTLIKRKSLDDFVKESNRAHKGRYLYDKVEYKNSFSNVTITCPKHGDFSQLPSHHIRGHGCPSCANYGFQPSKPANLYYLRIHDSSGCPWYKLGITNKNSIEERYDADVAERAEVLLFKKFDDGQVCRDFETRLKRKHKPAQTEFPDSDVLNGRAGNAEIYPIDILRLDNG